MASKEQIARAEIFLRRLKYLESYYGLCIDCHCDFVSALEDTQNNREGVAILYGDCEPEWIDPPSSKKENG